MTLTAMTAHAYLSTACQHELHPRCRLSCKFCKVVCDCYCHDEAVTEDWFTPEELAAERPATLTDSPTTQGETP